ncbi:MAG: transposase family protein [Cuspidothrix sp.]|jgi:transposase
MNREKGIKILTELVNIKDIKVISHRQHESIGIILQIEPAKKESICPRCRTKSQRLHQNHRYIVKDLPWGEKPVYEEFETIYRIRYQQKKLQGNYRKYFNI